MAELVDALVSGTSAERRGGSSPLLGTITRLWSVARGRSLTSDRAPAAHPQRSPARAPGSGKQLLLGGSLPSRWLRGRCALTGGRRLGWRLLFGCRWRSCCFLRSLTAEPARRPTDDHEQHDDDDDADYYVP